VRALYLEGVASSARLLDALFAEVDIGPSSEAILFVPRRLCDEGLERGNVHKGRTKGRRNSTVTQCARHKKRLGEKYRNKRGKRARRDCGERERQGKATTDFHEKCWPRTRTKAKIRSSEAKDTLKY